MIEVRDGTRANAGFESPRQTCYGLYFFVCSAFKSASSRPKRRIFPEFWVGVTGCFIGVYTYRVGTSSGFNHRGGFDQGSLDNEFSVSLIKASIPRIRGGFSLRLSGYHCDFCLNRCLWTHWVKKVFSKRRGKKKLLSR